jgi:hypothetical protein
MSKFMDTALPQIINTPEFLGAVMSKIANVSPELLTSEEFPKVAQHLFHGMSDYLQKEAGFTEENVISFTIGLAMTNPDFNEGFSKQAGLLDSIKQYGSTVVDKVSHPGDAVNSALNTGKAMLTGAAAGYQHPDMVNGLAGFADKASGVWNDYVKPFWDKNKDSIINAGVGALVGAGGNLLMGGNSPVSAGLVGAAGGYLAGPSIRDAYKNLTTPSATAQNPAVDPMAAATKQKLDAEKVRETINTTQGQQNLLNTQKPQGAH